MAGEAVTDDPVVLLSPVAGLHVYEFAPLAVSVANCPTQIAAGVLTEITGGGLTVTVTWVVAVHPLPLVPVTVYVVVEAGEAVTDEPVVELSPVAGLQVYELAPVAVSVVDCPAQIAAGETEITGGGIIVTVTCAVAVHPFLIPVTVYVVVVVGVAVTEAPVVLLNPVGGDQLYVVALPLAVRFTLCPKQMEVFGVTDTVGGWLTVTVTCAVHPPGEPVTVYVVVEAGDAVTEEPVVALNPVAGLHV